MNPDLNQLLYRDVIEPVVPKKIIEKFWWLLDQQVFAIIHIMLIYAATMCLTFVEVLSM